MTIVLVIALIFGFYMAWSIGANDAANAMGTSVGSGAVSFKEAVIIAAIFEFTGAFLAGADVTNTMRKGIIDPALFNALPQGSEIFALGMLAALMSAAIWIHIAAFLGWPVSTTHSIVGAITGFGTVALGVDQVQWSKVGFIVASWATSPLLGGFIAFSVFWAIKRTIMDAADPIRNVRRYGPIFGLPVFLVLSLMLFFKGLKNFYDKKQHVYAFFDSAIVLTEPLVYALAVALGVAGAVALGMVVRRMDLHEGISDDLSPSELKEAQNKAIERVFRYLQIITACFVAFAHGSNDVANSIGPLAAIVSMFDGMNFVGTISSQVPVPTWVLLLGAAGIVIGLASYGRKVIETIGTKITEITPSRGFAAEFGAATTILIGSKMGLPLSTTHTIVGAVIGVGFARGMNALNLGIVWSIIKSWVLTIPFTGVLTIGLFYMLKFFFL